MHNLYEETEEINDSLNQSICANKYVTKVYKIFVNEYECSFCCISRIIMLIAFIYLLCLWMGFFIEGTIEKMSNNTVTLPFCSERGYKLILGCPLFGFFGFVVLFLLVFSIIAIWFIGGSIVSEIYKDAKEIYKKIGEDGMKSDASKNSLGCLMDYYENFTENQNDSPELNDIHAEL